jgi:hypothetical protein
MTNIINLDQFRRDQDSPDPDCVTEDQEGNPMYAFLLDFEHDGGNFGMRIWAYDYADAERRVESIKQSLAVRGQLFAES